MSEGLQGITTATEERALKLLGSGVSPEQVASALGVTPARISQLLAEESFATQVADLKYKNLLQHSERDTKLDTLEDKLIGKIENLLPLIMRPLEAVKALQVVNGAKRRGAQGLSGATATQNIVQIAMPTQITQKFVTNIQNQVIQAGDQQLLTIQSGTLLKNIHSENPQLVQQLQESSTQAHSFNSTIPSTSAISAISAISLLSEGEQHGSPGLQGAGPNQASNCGQEATREEQRESRPATPIHFIPVGS